MRILLTGGRDQLGLELKNRYSQNIKIMKLLVQIMTL